MAGPSAQSNEPCLEQVRPAYAVQGLDGIEPEESMCLCRHSRRHKNDRQNRTEHPYPPYKQITFPISKMFSAPRKHPQSPYSEIKKIARFLGRL